MRKHKQLLAFAVLIMCLTAICVPASAASEPKNISFTHYASGGVTEEMTAVILFENKNSTFTKYQVAFPSCTCRDAASCYWSVMYVEILNTKASPEEASIRAISFGENKGARVGLWGDSDPVMGHPDYTSEYMAENFVSKLVGLTHAQADAWGGYGTQAEPVDIDAVSGATVSTSNITSVLQSVFDYHCEKYYK